MIRVYDRTGVVVPMAMVAAWKQGVVVVVACDDVYIRASTDRSRRDSFLYPPRRRSTANISGGWLPELQP